MAKILVVDDEKNILDVSKRYLERDGYTVLTAEDGIEALRKWRTEQPDLIVLDLMMPEKDGWKVCEEIRMDDDVPIIMLTARGEEMDRILGLTIGADDYMTKPFSPKELVLRIKSIFHRMKIGENRSQSDNPKSLMYGSLQIEPSKRLVLVNGEEINLTVKEFELLWMLSSHPNQVFSRTQILNKIWEIDFYGDTTTVTVHIRRIREKIEPKPSEPTYIKTVWGIGYKFEGTEKQ
ncbi:response regulator transcription factor [Pseudalkalibacillus sp. R45]|uniref:response regulator transcription factor n=1 Tax=Pseudalkalibacillus sp. R45 TaxID=3457433 RepID=UPI003FCC5022